MTKKLIDADYAAIEARCAADAVARSRETDPEPVDDGSPAARRARARWKLRNFANHYGTSGKMKDALS